MADLRRNVERNVISQRVQQNEVLGKIGVTDDEARAYYRAHMKEFTTSPSVTLREILVSTGGDARGVNVAADEAAKARAEQVRQRVTPAARPSTKLATDISDSPSRSNAGLIGPLSVNDISPDLRAVVEGLKVGGVSAVMRVGARLPDPQARSDDGDRDRCRSSRRATRSASTSSPRSARRSSTKYLEKLRAQAIIEWKNPEIKKAFDEGVKAGSDSPGWIGARTPGAPGPRSGTRSGRGRGTSRPSASSWNASTSTRSCRRSPRWSRWKDRKKKIDWPLFPGYCFACFDPADSLPVLKCAGVVNIVSFEGKPASIPESELESIRVLVGSDAAIRSLSDDSRRDDGGGRPRAAARRRRTPGAQGCAESAPRPLRESHRPGRQRRSGRRGRQGVLNHDVPITTYNAELAETAETR